jgi:hypothetical protein
MKKYPAIPAFLFVLLFFQSAIVHSQEKMPVSFGKISPADFNELHSTVIDSSTNAVIVADAGSTSFTGNKKGWLSYVFKKQKRIKIIDKKAFDAATVHVMLYKQGENEERIDNIRASSFNLVNGVVVESKLDKKDIFEEKRDKNHLEKKFTVPAVKEGTIIEYSYSITSDFYFNIPEWLFQDIKYPCLWSQYDISIPSLLGYVFIRQGIHPFFIDKSGQGQENYIVREKIEEGLSSDERTLTVSSITNKHQWVLKDVPALNIENYISTPYNYVDKIEFQLSRTYNGESTRDVKNTWAGATEELLRESDFGEPVQSGNDQFSTEVNKIIGTETIDLEKARAIYYYIRDNFTCTNFYNKYITTSLRDVYKKKSGNIGEINLLLIVMLRQAGIHADPVLLSTTEFGWNSPQYPVMGRLNYVVCRLVVNGMVYYVDAGVPTLGFGRLAQNCYNGHARIICMEHSASVYFRTDSLKEPKLTSVLISNDEKINGKMNGSYQSTPGFYESNSIRSKGEKEFFKNIALQFSGDFKTDNARIDSLAIYDMPVKVHYDFSFKNNADDDVIYFTPVFGEAYKENPFKATERQYPVEMKYPVDETYVLNSDIPNGYVIDELPKSIRVTYNNKDGFFEYIIQKNENTIMLRSHIKLNKAFFSADEYNSLRDFFAYIVKKQSEQVVFKKKK